MNLIKNESMFELKNLSNPLLSGDYIFYKQTSINEKENSYESQIFRINLKTKEITEWGNGGKTYNQLNLSKDKRELFFISNHTADKKMQVFVMSVNGGMAKQITFEKEGVSSYLLKDNFVFYHTHIKNEAEKSDDTKDFPKENVFEKLVYKADGLGNLPQGITYQFVKLNRANDEKEVLIERENSFTVAYVSKDYAYALYSVSKSEVDEWVYGSILKKYDFATKKEEKFIDTEHSMYFATANEKEDKLLLVSNDFSYNFVTQSNIVVYDTLAKTLTNVTKELDFELGDMLVTDFTDGTFSNFVKFINEEDFVFSVSEHGKITIYKASINGNLEKIFDQRLHLAGFSYEANQIAVTYSSLENPSRLGLIDITTAHLEEVHNPNQSFLETTKVATVDMFWYKAHDGLDIQGWYVHPVEESKKHPAILYVHGGPQVAYGESFFHEMQTLAAKGYGVIMLNPRGGNSYGQAFVASILGDYGNNDFKDLMNGLDFVLEKYPTIDQDNLFVAGGSYGGFMTNWIVGHTDRFKAASSQRCISNWVSFYGTSDIGAWFVENQLKNDLSNVEKLWEMSPLAYAKNVKTPLLLLHGEADLRCPMEQAEQMYTAMKKNGVDTKLVKFPQSSHGLSRNGLPNLRIKRLEATQAWFDRYREIKNS